MPPPPQQQQQEAGLVLVGAGAVGCNVLALVERAFGTQLAVVAIGDSHGVATASRGCGSPLEWRHVHAALAHKASSGDLVSDAISGVTYAATPLLQLVEALHAQRACKHFIVVDCTSSQTTAPALVRARQLGFGVVMANKLPLSATPFELYNAIVLGSDGNRSPLVQYEATVGAGLPVITTLKRMVASRDRILSVQGSFSGTIGYILAAMNRGIAFSAALRGAHALGITEPDPRDDLSGVDVARKMVILAREMGFSVDLASVAIAELIPQSYFALSVPEFLVEMPELDAGFHTKWLEADRDNGSRLAYLGTITESGDLRIALETVPRTSVFASTASTEGAIEIRSEWFPEPVVLRGTGAGIDSTAAALIADLAQVLDAFRDRTCV